MRSVSESLAGPLTSFDELPRIAREAASWGAPVFHFFQWWNRSEEMNQPHKQGAQVWDFGINPWWAYAFDQPGADPRKGGDDGLRQAIAQVHRGGSQVLLYVSPRSK